MGKKKRAPVVHPNSNIDQGVIKMVVVGGGGVGKSALVIRFVQNSFVTEYDPTIEDSYRKQIILDEVGTVCDVLDTAGMEEYSAMRDQYMRTGQYFIVCFAINSRASFEEVSIARANIQRIKDDDHVYMTLVGCKGDLDADRQISVKEAETLAKECQCKYFETSALTGHNIEEMMADAVRTYRIGTSSCPK